MKSARYTVTISLCLPFLIQMAVAKSDPGYPNLQKSRFSQKFNSVSSTPKPDFDMRKSSDYAFQGHSSAQRGYQQNPIPPISQHLQPFTQHLHPVGLGQEQLASSQVQQPQLHPQAQQQLIQLIQRALFTTQRQNVPTAMIIITQPAYASPNVPSALSSDNIIYGTPASINADQQQQQLLSYYRNNPQARYQFLHGSQQPSYQQLIPQPSPSQSMGSYQVITSPMQYQPNYAPSPIQTTHMAPATGTYQEAAPFHYNQISELAQAAADQYGLPVQLGNALEGSGAPVRSLPPIITGFENFSPEQQEKIKTQLSDHFGAPLQPLPVGKGSSQVVAQQSDKGAQNSRQYVVNQKYQTSPTRLNNQEFVPSPQVKDNMGRSQRSSYTKF